MREHDPRADWSILGAVALIIIGVWLLLGRLAGPWWDAINSTLRFAASLAWPVALIAGGVLLLIAGRRGGLGAGAGGKRLYRSRSDRLIGGVLGGLATYLGVDSTWLRVIFVILGLLTSVGPAALLYVFAMILLPEEPSEAPAAPVWPQPQPPGTETVQVPPPAPPAAPGPEPPPAAPEPPPAPPAAPAAPAPPAAPTPPQD